MYDLSFIDEYVLEACKRTFSRIYPEFRYRVLGVTQDKQELIFECYFPDGTFYFRVNENSVSSSYNTRDEADRD